MGEFEAKHRHLIAVAEACQRPVSPSHSWHVFAWLAYRLRCKYPLRRDNGVLNWRPFV